jgi:hypothetical protein
MSMLPSANIGAATPKPGNRRPVECRQAGICRIAVGVCQQLFNNRRRTSCDWDYSGSLPQRSATDRNMGVIGRTLSLIDTESRDRHCRHSDSASAAPVTRSPRLAADRLYNRIAATAGAHRQRLDLLI